MKVRNSVAVVIAGLIVHGIASAERRDHGAHVHGIAEMDVAVLGDEVEIALRSPAMNMVGFEHAPRTDEQRERLNGAVDSLRDGDALFAFGDALCRLLEAEVHHAREPNGHGYDALADDEHADHEHDEHEHDEGEHGEGEHDEAHDGATHSEIRAHYHFACERTVERVDIGLFERFPRSESIRVQYLTDDTQGAQTLTPEATVLRLE